jgi:cell pole-organizing protein PopZ
LVLFGAAAPAAAKPARRHHAPAPSPANAALAAQVQELTSEVAALTARLNAQDAAQQQARADAAAARDQAQQAQATAQAAQTQVAAAQAAVPAEVKTALAAQPRPPARWFDNTTISGRMFFNVSHIDQHSDGQLVGRSTGLDVKRLYIGIDHKFSDIWSANATTDISLIANTNTVTGTANSGTAQPGQGTTAPAAFPKTVGETIYLKKAYLQGKFNDALILRIGSADMPWIAFAEDVYGYRYVDPTLIDRTGFGNSADWGLHLLGSFDHGLVSYQVSAVDGGGYRNPLRSQTVDLEGRVSLNYKGFVAGVGGYSGKRAADTLTPFSPTNNAVTPVQTGTQVATFHRAERFDALLGYSYGNLRVGAEYFWSKDWNQVTKVPNDTSDGWSAFASYKFNPLFGLFGRYDRVNPTRDLFPNIRENYFNFGLTYSPTKIVDLALVYKRDRVENGFFAPSNANPSNFAFPIGGRNQGTYDEFGLFGQFRF